MELMLTLIGMASQTAGLRLMPALAVGVMNHIIKTVSSLIKGGPHWVAPHGFLITLPLTNGHSSGPAENLNDVVSTGSTAQLPVAQDVFLRRW